MITLILSLWRTLVLRCILALLEAEEARDLPCGIKMRVAGSDEVRRVFAVASQIRGLGKKCRVGDFDIVIADVMFVGLLAFLLRLLEVMSLRNIALSDSILYTRVTPSLGSGSPNIFTHLCSRPLRCSVLSCF